MPRRGSSAVTDADRWLAWVRIGAVPFAVFQVATSGHYPGHYKLAAWTATAVFGTGAVAFLALTRSRRPRLPIAFASVAFDTTIISAYILIYSYEQSTPVRQLIFLPIAEGALLYGIRGSVALALVTAPVIAVFEWLRSRRNVPHSYQVNFVTFQIGVGLLMAWSLAGSGWGLRASVGVPKRAAGRPKRRVASSARGPNPPKRPNAWPGGSGRR